MYNVVAASFSSDNYIDKAHEAYLTVAVYAVDLAFQVISVEPGR